MERTDSIDLGPTSRLSLAGLVLDLQHGELLDAAGRQVDLRRQALDVLLVLAAKAGHVVGKGELMDRVWPGVVVTEDSLVQAIADVRRVLGDREHLLVRTVPRRGYLLALPLGEAITVTPVPGGTALRPKQRRRLIMAAAVLLVAVALWWGLSLRVEPSGEQGPPQIAVLAFHERGRAVEAASLGAGLSEDLVMELGRNQGLNVVAHHSSFALSGKGLSTAELGRQLHAQYLIDGVVQRDGERLDLEVELVDVRAEKVLWVSRQQAEGGEVVRARDAIVRKVAGTLFSKMRESEKQRAVRAPPKSLDVYAWTQRGLALKHQFTPEATREARAGLERALVTDPQYAAAWWVLGWLNAVDAWMVISGEWTLARMPEAIAQINRGIELDPYSSAAHQALAVALGMPQTREQALAAAQRAVELAPGDAEAWLFLAMTMLPLRPPEQALAAAERAMEMNPIPPTYFLSVYARALWANGHDEAALREAQACNRRAPLYNDCRFVQLMVHASRGQFDQASEHLVVLKRSEQRADAYCTANATSADRASQCRKLAVAAGLTN
jgi:TolB-like protein/DNA-binding winged helix-turn-helix (wHTH) protein